MAQHDDAITRTQRFAAALVEGDADTLDALLAPDGNYVHSSARVEPFSELISTVRDGRRYARFDVEDLSVRGYDPDTRIVQGLAHLEIPMQDGPYLLDSRFSAIWVGSDDASRLAQYHSTRVPRE